MTHALIKRLMPGFLLRAALVLFFAAGLCAAADQPAPPAVVATVNGAAISETEFQISLDRLKQRFQQQGGQLNDAAIKKLEADAMDGLISQELLFQESQKSGFRAEKTDVDQQIARFKERFSSEEAFGKALEERGLTLDMLTVQIRKGIAIQRFVQDRFVSRTEVSPAESREFYDANPNLFMQPETVRASHILVKLEAGADETRKAEAEAKIERILEELGKGADFADVARRHSEGPSAPNGGDLGFFRRGQMVGPFEEAAFALEPGEISQKVETRFGYHIIRVAEKKAAGPVAYDEAQERITRHLAQVKTDRAVRGHIDTLRAGADIQRFR